MTKIYRGFVATPPMVSVPSGYLWFATRTGKNNVILQTFESAEEVKTQLEGIIRGQQIYTQYGYTAWVTEEDEEGVRVVSHLKFTPAPLSLRWQDQL